jgi:PKD-like domain
MKKHCIIASILFSIFIESYSQYNNVTIYTPNNHSVTAGIFTGTDWTQSEKAAAKAYYLNYYNNRIIFMGDATKTYNCHAYAWHMSEGGSTVWVDNPQDNKYWDDCSYYPVTSQSSAKKVSFGEISNGGDDHSAITVAGTSYLISKWGPQCLFKHLINDCPYQIGDLHYYTRADISGSLYVGSNNTTFTLNNMQPGKSVTWSTIGALTYVSGQSTTSYVVRAWSNGSLSTGVIKASITNGCGTLSQTTKNISINGPFPNDIKMHVWSDYEDPTTSLCANTTYHFFIYTVGSCNFSSWTWSFPAGWVVHYTGGGLALVTTNSSAHGLVEVTSTTCCASGIKVYSHFWSQTPGCDNGYYLTFTPNPTISETILKLNAISSEDFDENTEWDLEIFSQSQMLMTKKVRLKGSQHIISTSGWNAGIYFVRVIMKDKLLTGSIVIIK